MPVWPTRGTRSSARPILRPTTVQVSAITAARTASDRALARWRAVKTIQLPALNALLKTEGLAPVTP